MFLEFFEGIRLKYRGVYLDNVCEFIIVKIFVFFDFFFLKIGIVGVVDIFVCGVWVVMCLFDDMFDLFWRIWEVVIWVDVN